MCAVCGQYQRDAEAYDLMSGLVRLDLDILRLRDQFIIEKCIVQHLSPRFNYNNPHLDGFMLAYDGVLSDQENSGRINICRECFAALSKKKVPRFALANGLFRGSFQ